MKYFDYAEKLDTIKYLAEHKKAGTPSHLAKKLNVSERTVQRMVQQLRDHGFPITYNRFRCTYEVNLLKFKE
jgi:predicted DNA-binding transcriptional regulator YafY